MKSFATSLLEVSEYLISTKRRRRSPSSPHPPLISPSTYPVHGIPRSSRSSESADRGVSLGTWRFDSRYNNRYQLPSIISVSQPSGFLGSSVAAAHDRRRAGPGCVNRGARCVCGREQQQQPGPPFGRSKGDGRTGRVNDGEQPAAAIVGTPGRGGGSTRESARGREPQEKKGIGLVRSRSQGTPASSSSADCKQTPPARRTDHSTRAFSPRFPFFPPFSAALFRSLPTGCRYLAGSSVRHAPRRDKGSRKKRRNTGNPAERRRGPDRRGTGRVFLPLCSLLTVRLARRALCYRAPTKKFAPLSRPGFCLRETPPGPLIDR